MAFEKFTKVSYRGFVPKVSLWKRGQIGFNRAAVEKYNLNNYTHAVLYYDRASRRIGFHFTSNEGEEGAIKIAFGKTSAVIGAKVFLDYYDIKPDVTTKYDVSLDREEDMYVIQLKAMMG